MTSSNPTEQFQLTDDGSVSIPIIREESDHAPPTDIEVEVPTNTLFEIFLIQSSPDKLIILEVVSQKC